MTALDPAVWSSPQPDEHVAAKRLDQSEPLSDLADIGQLDASRSRRQSRNDLLDQPQALLDFADADPYPRIDVAVVAHRHLELERIIGGIASRLTHVEGAARGAPHI